MKIWKLAALPIALLSGQALAENWVAVVTDDAGFSTSVDKDSIRRGNDGLVYYTVDDADAGKGDEAADCQRRIYYMINAYTDGGKIDFPNWREKGAAVNANSRAEAELQYACANAR